MSPTIFIASSDEQILSCFPAFKALRPHLHESEFLSQVRRQQSQSYQILALSCNRVVQSAAGFRLAEFLAWGKVLYIDDLTTLPNQTGQGLAGSLLDWLIEHAKANQCRGLHLDTGYTRFAAHRLYLRKKLQLNAHHMALELQNA